MIKIAVVVLAYMLIYMADNYAVEYYYFACSAAYACVAALSAACYIKINSKLLLLYATVSLLTSAIHFAMQNGYYEQLKHVLWYAPLNFSLIAQVIELMLVFTGVCGLVLNIIHMLNVNINKRQNRADSLVDIK